MKAILHTDGGARGNPGPAGIGVVLQIDEEVITEQGFIGETTNNQAEYQALRRGVELALAHGVTELTCKLDSELLVKQLKGEYRVKNAELRPHFEAVKALMRKFDHISFNHVPRGKNKAADALVNEAIDSATGRAPRHH